MGIAPPRTAETPGPSEWNGDREAHRADCVRIVHKHRNLLAHAPERLHEEFRRRIKTQTVLPSAESAALLFWALLASGQIRLRKVDGWQTLGEKLSEEVIDLAA